MKVVRNLDLERYMGRWYEIACFPSRFQPRDGTNTRATYTLAGDGAVKVLNETWTDGRRGHIEGTAYRADPVSDEAKLKVKFYVPPFLPIFPVVGDYWVLHVDDAYSYALVGQPSLNYLWVRIHPSTDSYPIQVFRSTIQSLICIAGCVLCRSCAGSRTWTRRCTASWWRGPRRRGTT